MKKGHKRNVLRGVEADLERKERGGNKSGTTGKKKEGLLNRGGS